MRALSEDDKRLLSFAVVSRRLELEARISLYESPSFAPDVPVASSVHLELDPSRGKP
jgi:hypothetical protein